MELKKSMDVSQIVLLATTNEQIYMKERTGDTFFSSDNDPEKKSNQTATEPAFGFCAVGTYPLKYVLDFFKLGKSNGATHMKIEMGRENRPLRLEFESNDNLNQENGKPKREKTWLWCAPRVSNDDLEEKTKEQLEATIKIYENEILILKGKMPKEEVKEEAKPCEQSA